MNEAQKPSIRRVTKGKLERDAERIKTYARFVIVLGGNGTVSKIIDNERRKKNLPYAKIIAVVSDEGILMEIGYSRTRPYSQLEGWTRKEDGTRLTSRWHLKARPRARALTDGEFAQVYPYIIKCME